MERREAHTVFWQENQKEKTALGRRRRMRENYIKMGIRDMGRVV